MIATRQAVQPSSNLPGAHRYQADLIFIAGSPDTGKSTFAKSSCAASSRLLVWDPSDEYRAERCRRIASIEALYWAMRQSGSGAARLAFVPTDLNEFSMFCRLAWAWAEPDAPGRAPCTVLVDDIADVVPYGKAPRWWGVLVRRGRHRGLRVRAVSHSPAETDKTSIRAATLWHVHALGGESDREYMARQMGVDRAALDGLKPFEYIEVRRAEIPRVIVRGVTKPRSL